MQLAHWLLQSFFCNWASKGTQNVPRTWKGGLWAIHSWSLVHPFFVLFFLSLIFSLSVLFDQKKQFCLTSCFGSLTCQKLQVSLGFNWLPRWRWPKRSWRQVGMRQGSPDVFRCRTLVNATGTRHDFSAALRSLRTGGEKPKKARGAKGAMAEEDVALMKITAKKTLGASKTRGLFCWVSETDWEKPMEVSWAF